MPLRDRLRGIKHRLFQSAPDEKYKQTSNGSVTSVDKASHREEQASSVGDQQNTHDVSLWEQAYKIIDTDLKDQYEKILSEEWKKLKPEDKTTDRREQQSAIIERSLQKLDTEKPGVKEGVAKFAKCAQSVKEFVDAAVKASPEASLVWAGVCVALPLLTNPQAASEANKSGFHYVTSRLAYYLELEHLLWSIDGCEGRQIAKLESKFLHSWIELYKRLLEFQLESVIRMHSRHFAKDIFGLQDWEGMIASIKELEAMVDRDAQQINASLSRQDLEQIRRNSDNLIDSMHEYLDVAGRQFEISKDQLEIQQQILDRLPDKEKECLQLFRLARDDRDDTYEWYKNRVQQRLEGTCKWFLSQPNYTNWLKQDSGLLIVSADPGCGKSVLARYLIDSEFEKAKLSTKVCYFFFKDRDQDTQKQTLCALLHQMLCFRPELIEHAIPAFDSNGDNLVNVTHDLWNIFAKVATDPRMGRLVFVLDAMDECKERDRNFLVTEVKSRILLKGIQNHVSILLTTRPYDNVLSGFYDLMNEYPEIRIPGEKESERIAEEVNLVIKDRVHELGTKKRLNQKLKSHLEERLLKMPHRTYLWVYLVFEYLDTHSFEKRTNSIDKIIDNFPTGLNSVYESLLMRSENRYMARKAFCIILAATRPLDMQEMNIAVHVDKSSTDLDELESNEDFEITLRNWCGLLVSINANKVYLLHQTTREYLLQAGLSGCADGQDGPITMQEAHAVLAFSCIGFLELAQQKPEFLDYSINNWTTHTRDSSLNRDHSFSPRLEKLCDPHEGTAGHWIPHYQGQEDYQFSYPWQNIDLEHLNTLWIASAFGMTAPVQQILQRGKVSDVVDKFERNAVLMAAHGGHDSVLKLLVDSNQLDVNCCDFWDLTAFSFAVMLGSPTLVRILLDCGKLDLSPKRLMVPFQSAMENGNDEIVDMLLRSEQVSDVDFKFLKGDTPLIMACRMGKEGIVSLILDSGKANLNIRGSGGSTALAVATREEQEGVVRLLLGNETVHTNAPDDNGWTAFLCAADTRNVTLIQLFIDSGKVDYTKKLNDDSTALHLAVQNNSVDAVKALLPVTVQVDALDDERCTPLIYAAWNGYENATRLLLESGRVDVNLRGGVSDNTPLSFAKSSGHHDIVKLLLEFGAIDD